MNAEIEPGVANSCCKETAEQGDAMRVRRRAEAAVGKQRECEEKGG